jgi:hypothetical protein
MVRYAVKFTPAAEPWGEHLDIIGPLNLGKWRTTGMHLSFPAPVYDLNLEPVIDEVCHKMPGINSGRVHGSNLF